MDTQGLVNSSVPRLPLTQYGNKRPAAVAFSKQLEEGRKRQDKRFLSLKERTRKMCSPLLFIFHGPQHKHMLTAIRKRGQEVQSLAERPLRRTVPLQGRKEQQSLLFHLVSLLLFYCWGAFASYSFPFGECFTVSPFTFTLCSHILCVSSSNCIQKYLNLV